MRRLLLVGLLGLLVGLCGGVGAAWSGQTPQPSAKVPAKQKAAPPSRQAWPEPDGFRELKFGQDVKGIMPKCTDKDEEFLFRHPALAAFSYREHPPCWFMSPP